MKNMKNTKSTKSTKPETLFDAPANRSMIQTFNCSGFKRPVVGTVYPRASFRWHGVPLGGLGTGYVTWDPDGRFGQCTIFNQVPAHSQVPVLKTIPFRATVDGQSFELAMRSTPDGESGAGRYAESTGDLWDLRYFGHYPIVDAQFEIKAPLAIEIRAFGPFLPGDATESNTPAIVFEVSLANTGDKPLDAEIFFTPPAPPHKATGSSAFSKGKWQGSVVRHPMVKAIPMMGQRPIEHELAVAAEGGRSATDGTGLSASFSAKLAPGASVRTRFILAWWQPYIRDAGNRGEKLKYVERFADAASVARHAMAQHETWLQRIIAWQGAIYAHEEYSPAMREALVNSCYCLCKNAHWIAKWRPDDWYGPEGLFLVNESYTTCPISETLVCHSTHFPMLFFFPEMERTTLNAFRHFQLSTGELPFGLSPGFGARAPNYQCQHPGTTSVYIDTICRHWLRTGDDAFLKDFYPSARAALKYMEFLDTDSDGLINEHPHALPGENWPANVGWDQWPQRGTSGYNGPMSLMACLALEKMARKVGDTETADRCLSRVERGRKRLEEILWNGEYYRLCADPATGHKDDTCLCAQVCGTWAAAYLGLESPLPVGRVDSALKAILRLNSNLSEYGLTLAASPKGEQVYSNLNQRCDFPRDPFPIFDFIVTAMCEYRKVGKDGWWGTDRMLEALFRKANAMPWGWPCNMHGVDGFTGHGHDYQDGLSIWILPLAMKGQDVKSGTGPGSLVHEILTATNKETHS